MDYNAAALEMHAKYPGKLTVNSLFEVLPPDQGKPGRCV